MAVVSNLFQGGGKIWMPDADKVNAPDGALLRADNLVPDAVGALSLRRGSSLIYSSLGTEVHTLYAAELSDSSTYRIAGVDDTIQINGSAQVTGVDGSGDLAIADDSYQIFMARGQTKKKYSGSELHNWGIARPISAPTLAAGSANTVKLAEFDNSESPAVTAPEGTAVGGGAFSRGSESDPGGTANKASIVAPNTSTYRAVLQRVYASDTDYFNVSGLTGSETDLFDMSVKFANPRNVKSVKIIIGISDPDASGVADAFDTDRFEFEFNIEDGIEIPIKDLASEGYGAYEESVLKSLTSVSPSEVTNVQTPEQVKTGLANVGEVPAPTSQGPPDGAVWGHLTVTRGQFKRIGSTNGRSWETVRGFKVVYKTIQGKTDAITVADALFVGGGDRTLTGNYRCVLRAVRQYQDAGGTTRYYELSPPSDQTDPIYLNHQTLQVTIPAALLNNLDEQVDQIWVYLFGGWLDAYYRFAVVPSEVNQGMSIDELKSPEGSNFDDAVKRSRIPSWGFTYVQTGTGNKSISSITRSTTTATVTTSTAHGYATGDTVVVVDSATSEFNGTFVITVTGASTFTYTVPDSGADDNPASGVTCHVTLRADYNPPTQPNKVYGDATNKDTNAAANIVLLLRTSELDALTENERLEPYLMLPPDNIIDIAGPWRGRLYTLTTEGYVYPSTQRDPGSFNSLQVIDLTRFGDPKWIAAGTNGVYVGMEKDIVFLAGTGNDSVDLAQIDIYPQPLGVGNPPTDSCHWREGNAILYRSTDGLMQLTGNSVTPVPFAGTSLLWRGQDRHDVEALNVTSGRFRMTVDNRMLYMLAPEGSVTDAQAMWRYSLDQQQWSRFEFAQAGDMLSIFNEPDGTLVMGDDEGNVWQLETGTQDNGNNISMFIRTPIEDGGNPLSQKDAFDLQLHGTTGGSNATVNLFKNGTGTSGATFTANMGAQHVWRGNASGLGTFIKAQMEILGSFSEFILNSYVLTYRNRPQHMMYLDTGYYQSPEPGDLLWMQEVELDCNSPSDITMKLYFDDVLWYTATITVTANVRTVYRVPLPRGSKGLRPRLVFYTTASNAEGEVGFDPYSVRVRAIGSGNQDQDRRYVKIWPAGEAP